MRNYSTRAVTVFAISVFLWSKSFLFVSGKAHLPINDSFGSDDDKLGGYQSWIWDDRNYLYPTLPIAAPWSEDKVCRDESRLLISHLKNNTLWAMQMWDSSAKTPLGVLYGQMFQLGNFDECLRVEAPIKAQYCLVQISANFSMERLENKNPYLINTDPFITAWQKIQDSEIDPSKVRRTILNWGLCVPSSCSNVEMKQSINSHLLAVNALYPHDNYTKYTVEIPDGFCTKPHEEDDFTLGEFLFWSFSFVLISLTVSSTAADFWWKKNLDTKSSKLQKLWMLFSAKQNAHMIFKTENPEKRNSIDILHGVKFFSIISVLYGHRIGIFLGLSATNYHEVEELLRTDNNMFFVHSDLVVDTFFFISGLLVCYFLIDFFTDKLINPLYAIFFRISRLAPAYFFVLWFQTAAVLRLGSGPLWNVIAKQENQFCVSNWWTNVLFISNYVHSKEMCMPHSWFIPCDLHFFIMAVPLVMILARNKKIGLSLMFVLIIVTTIIPGIITYVYKLQPLVIFYSDFLAQPRSDDSFDTLYIKSHNRVTTYLIGMVTGYFLYSVRNSEKKISKVATLCGCVAWLAFLFAPMAYGSLYYDPSREYNVIESSIFASLRRLSWAIGLTIFMISHRFGKIPVLGPIFSSKVSVALSNITYGIYLIHFNLIMSHIEKLRALRPFKIYDAVMEGFADLITSMLLATILLLALEYPLKRILRELLLAKQVEKIIKKSDMKRADSTITVPSQLEMPSVSTVRL